MTAKLPSWVPVLARLVLTGAALLLGVRMYFDGYSPAVVTIASGLLVSELVGLGLSRTQAQEAVAAVTDLIRSQSKPPPPAPPSG